MKIRVKFRKYGAVRFIGHLDVMRFFQKANRRAGIDVAYSGGYSPHQIMSFAAPLGVGLTSNGEYMDLEIHSAVSSEDIKERLNQASVPGIEIVSVKFLPKEAGNAMASVAAAAYTVTFREGREPKCNVEKTLPLFLAKEQILFTKESKKGQREVDLKQGIYDIKYKDGIFSMLLDASSAGNIKPSQVIEAFLMEQNESLAENALLVVREDTYMNIGTSELPEFVPLDAIGSTELPTLEEPQENADES